MAEEKRVEEMLDGKKAEEVQENGQEQGKKEMTPEERGQLLRETFSGKIELMQPFMMRETEVKEIEYDFCKLNGDDLMDALDSAPGGGMFQLSNKQALMLFAVAAEKCAPTVREDNTIIRLYDKRDIKSKLGAADSVAAANVAKLFYRASNQAGSQNISKK